MFTGREIHNVLLSCESKPTILWLSQEEWARGEKAIDPINVMLGDRIVCEEHVTLDGTGPEAIGIDPQKTPSDMTPAQWAKHALTHPPYHPGCSICAACKRPNTVHLKSHEYERIIPLLVSDYACCRDSKDEGLATRLILRLFPYRLCFCFCHGYERARPIGDESHCETNHGLRTDAFRIEIR